MQGHSRSGVVMDIAAFKVSHSVVIDRDATTLQAEKARSASIGAMQVQGMFKMQAHISRGVVMDIAIFKVSHSVDSDATALRAARVRSGTIGAMERYTWVRFAGKLTSDCHRTHSNGQNISEAMESYMRGFDLAQNSQGSATRHRQQ
jgi:hypothetical protein